MRAVPCGFVGKPATRNGDAGEVPSNRPAHWLVAQGVRPESRVELVLPRSVGLVVAMLGVLKAGGVYAPGTRCLLAQRIGQLTDQIQDLERRQALLAERHVSQLIE
ncbi:AMP-binding protein [Streptomyces tubercidicus]